MSEVRRLASPEAEEGSGALGLRTLVRSCSVENALPMEWGPDPARAQAEVRVLYWSFGGLMLSGLALGHGMALLHAAPAWLGIPLALGWVILLAGLGGILATLGPGLLHAQTALQSPWRIRVDNDCLRLTMGDKANVVPWSEVREACWSVQARSLFVETRAGRRLQFPFNGFRPADREKLLSTMIERCSLQPAGYTIRSMGLAKRYRRGEGEALLPPGSGSTLAALAETQRESSEGAA